MKTLTKIATCLLLSLCAFTFAHAHKNPHKTPPKSKVVQAKNCSVAHRLNSYEIRKEVRKKATRHCSTQHDNAKVVRFEYEALACKTHDNRKTHFSVSFSTNFNCGNANSLNDDLGSINSMKERITFEK